MREMEMRCSWDDCHAGSLHVVGGMAIEIIKDPEVKVSVFY